MEKIGIYVGSFDPFTIGHKSIVDKSLTIFDKVIIGIGINSSKTRRSDVGRMKNAISNLFKYKPVEVYVYNDMSYRFFNQHNGTHFIRGIRNTQDFEYEKTLMEYHKREHSIDTMFFMSDPELSYISSSMVRELLRHDIDVSKYVPEEILKFCYI